MTLYFCHRQKVGDKRVMIIISRVAQLVQFYKVWVGDTKFVHRSPWLAHTSDNIESFDW